MFISSKILVIYTDDFIDRKCCTNNYCLLLNKVIMTIYNNIFNIIIRVLNQNF